MYYMHMYYPVYYPIVIYRNEALSLAVKEVNLLSDGKEIYFEGFVVAEGMKNTHKPRAKKHFRGVKYCY